MKKFQQLTSKQLTGSECFHNGGAAERFRVLDFWRWSVSDLVSNATRGRLAEFIVARALGVSTGAVRDEWAAYDLLTPEGIKIEVKSAAYLQSWTQIRPSTISFSVRRARTWDPGTNQLAAIATRAADVYVFALLRHQDKATLDPLDLGQWEFFVVGTGTLNQRQRSQYSISVNSLRRLRAGPMPFDEVRDAVLRAVRDSE